MGGVFWAGQGGSVTLSLGGPCGVRFVFVAVSGKGLHAPWGALEVVHRALPVGTARGWAGSSRAWALLQGLPVAPSGPALWPSSLDDPSLEGQWAHLPHSGCVILAGHCLSGLFPPLGAGP